jgi:beta-lactam-binding protein with PASTA domain
VFKSITNGPLWVNIIASVVLTVALFTIFFLSLNWLTNHGSSTTVPSVAGKKYDEAEKQLTNAGFEIEIQDSIYVESIAPLTVIKQIPDGGEVVKSNRTVYLIINRSVPPFVEMPDIKGFSFRNAEMVLKNLDLRIGDTSFKHDFAKNSVLEQIYNGNNIEPGTKIRKGSSISLILGDGIGNREFTVPNITGMLFSDAKKMLEENGLGFGAVIIDDDVKDKMNAWIYKQKPERFDDEKKPTHIRSGQMMDVWLQVDQPIIEDSLGVSFKLLNE